MSRPLCPCVYCETDRERGRRQYIIQWSDAPTTYMGAGDEYKAPKSRALVYGVRHAAWCRNPYAQALLVGNKQHALTIAACRRDPKHEVFF